MLPEMEEQSPNHWTAKEFPTLSFFKDPCDYSGFTWIIHAILPIEQGLPFAAVHGLLAAVASLVEHRL